jgi:hypothetical protein
MGLAELFQLNSRFLSILGGARPLPILLLALTRSAIALMRYGLPLWSLKKGIIALSISGKVVSFSFLLIL